MSGVGMALQGVGSLFGAGAAISGGIAQSKALKQQAAYEAQTYQYNAALADLQARSAITRGEKDVLLVKDQMTKLRRARNTTIEAQRAKSAAAGVEVDYGSDLESQLDITYQAEEGLNEARRDIETIRANAWAESFGYKVEALNYRQAARWGVLSAKNAAKNTLISTGMNVAGSLFGSAGEMYGSYSGGGSAQTGGSSAPARRGGSAQASPFLTGYK